MATTLGFVPLSLLALFSACTLHGCSGGEGGDGVEGGDGDGGPSKIFGVFQTSKAFSEVNDLQAFCRSVKASDFHTWTMVTIADGTCQPVISIERPMWGAVMTVSADMATLTARVACQSSQSSTDCTSTDSTCATAGTPQLYPLDAEKFAVGSCERLSPGGTADPVFVTAVKLEEGNFQIPVPTSTTSTTTTTSKAFGVFQTSKEFPAVADLQAFCRSVKATDFHTWTLFSIADGTCQPIVANGHNTMSGAVTTVSMWGVVMTVSADMATLTVRVACQSSQSSTDCIFTDSTCATATGAPQLVQLDAEKFAVGTCERLSPGGTADPVLVTATKFEEGNFQIPVPTRPTAP